MGKFHLNRTLSERGDEPEKGYNRRGVRPNQFKGFGEGGLDITMAEPGSIGEDGGMEGRKGGAWIR